MIYDSTKNTDYAPAIRHLNETLFREVVENELVTCGCCGAAKHSVTYNVYYVALEGLAYAGLLESIPIGVLCERRKLTLSPEDTDALAEVKRRSRIDVLREKVFFSKPALESHSWEHITDYITGNLVQPFARLGTLKKPINYTFKNVAPDRFAELSGHYVTTPVQLCALYQHSGNSVDSARQLIDRNWKTKLAGETPHHPSRTREEQLEIELASEASALGEMATSGLKAIKDDFRLFYVRFLIGSTASLAGLLESASRTQKEAESTSVLGAVESHVRRLLADLDGLIQSLTSNSFAFAQMANDWSSIRASIEAKLAYEQAFWSALKA